VGAARRQALIDLSVIPTNTVLGRVLRAPLRLVPATLEVPIVQGPLRGARWIVGSSTHGCWLGCYEAAMQRACAGHIRSGMTVYDIGANVGFYTLLFSRLVGARGSVHAFEPVPRNLQFLRRHLRLNSVLNVCVHETAVGAASGVSMFDPRPGPSMGRLTSGSGAGTTEVPVAALDDLVCVTGHEPPHVVKMDIEGGEVDALHGMRRVLERHHPTLLLATHGTPRWLACRDILRGFGYELRNLDGRPADTPSPGGEIVAVPGHTDVLSDRGRQVTVHHA
jgi:FkbM family methyltransferase